MEEERKNVGEREEKEIHGQLPEKAAPRVFNSDRDTQIHTQLNDEHAKVGECISHTHLSVREQSFYCKASTYRVPKYINNTM